MRTRRARLYPVILLSVLAACGGAEARTETSIVRDSAGIRIVESHAPPWTDAERWRVSDEPVLSIGELDGPEEYQLFHIVGAHRFSDGTIVAANGGTQELRFYGPDGRFLHTVGGRGGGPGEFRSVHSSYIAQDTVFVFELMAQRMSVFAPDGTQVRAFPVSVSDHRSMLRPVGRLSDGSWVITSIRFPNVSSGLIRDTVVYYHLPDDGASPVLVGEFAGSEADVSTREDSGMMMVMLGSVPFGRRASATTGGDRLLFASSDRYEIASYRMDGSLEALFRREHAPAPVSDEDLVRWEAWKRPSVPPAEANTPVRTPASTPLPQMKAAHGPVHIDLAGNLWIAEYIHPDLQPVEWSVFDADGRWLGQVATPERFRITEFGEDYLLGVARDELDVEYVHLYRLIKP